MTQRIVRIGGASGAWGDSPGSVAQLLQAQPDYLMMDFLAEVTMSLLARARMKDPDAGFAPDFVAYLKPHLAELKRRGIRVVGNAGGVNPQACKRALEAAAAELGIALRVAVVEGDDVLPLLPALRVQDVREWRTGAPIPARLLTANAYLGALPIGAALARGADIVVTGRCVDSALALGVLMHEFGWQPQQYDLLASGSLVGHLLECGPQATGGLYTDWEQVPGWSDIGYPIAECRADGDFVVTKPAGTGGMVTPATVAEQVLYEIGDPSAYLLPDVSADFTQISLTQQGVDRVEVRGARGRPPSGQYKVSATFQDGWRAVALVAIIGVDAARKAERTAQALVQRAESVFAACGFEPFSAVHVEALGAEAAYGTQSRARASREVVLRLVVDHADRKALERFAREVGSAGLSFAQGTAGLIGGRPKAAPLVRLFTFCIDKAALDGPWVQLGDDERVAVPVPHGAVVAPPPASPAAHPPSAAVDAADSNTTMVEVALIEVAHARSGDKGDTSNIAIFCRDPAYMDHLREVLTPQRVAAQFDGIVHGSVVRYEAPGLAAFNFVLDRALGGGGMSSQRLDALGKSYGQRALELRVSVPRSWVVES